MVKPYIKKSKLYTEDELIEAANKVISGELSERKAAAQRQFSRTLLRDKISELKGQRKAKTTQGEDKRFISVS